MATVGTACARSYQFIPDGFLHAAGSADRVHIAGNAVIGMIYWVNQGSIPIHRLLWSSVLLCAFPGCMMCRKDADSLGQPTGDVGVEPESPSAMDPLQSPSSRDMAESKLNAFGLPVPRSMLLRSRSGGGSQRGGRPPLAPVSPDMPSSATSSSRSLNVGQGASGLQAEPCTSGYETPVQVLLPLLAQRQLPPMTG